MNVKPLGDRVLVKPLAEEEAIAGGIIIPDTAKEKPQEGEVVAIGTCKLINGEKVDFSVAIGDRVLLPKYGGTEVKINGEKLQLIREDDILAIVE
jgi:chaperonin GroES